MEESASLVGLCNTYSLMQRLEDSMFLLLLKHRRKITLSNIILHRKNDIFKIIAQKLNIGHDVFTFFFYRNSKTLH